MRSGARARIPAGLVAAVVVSLSLFGLSQSPNLFIYGRWPMILAAGPKPPQASAFFVGWGSSDPAARADKRLVGQLRASGYSVSTAVVTGGHQRSAWRSLLTASLDQLGDVVGAPSGD